MALNVATVEMCVVVAGGGLLVCVALPEWVVSGPNYAKPTPPCILLPT